MDSAEFKIHFQVYNTLGLDTIFHVRLLYYRQR